MAQIRSFRELTVYQRAVKDAKSVFLLTSSFPKEERYSLTDQIRRSSRAVAAIIAEAWARRRYPAAFISKLNEALGEAMETQAWLDHSLECNYLEAEDHAARDDEWQQIGAMIAGMIDRADDFCRHASS
jgi:four helix bundle protein